MQDKQAGPKPNDAKRSGRRKYAAPKLVTYGEVRILTQAGTASRNEGSPGKKKVGGSDRQIKENIVRIGTHPLGIGLYLFDYKSAFRALYGSGRQFGVMADEVEPILPAAVSRHESGFKLVDYAVLGIDRES